jgi:rhodanese-related sulfurtransferase
VRGAVDGGLQGRFAEWAGDVLDPDRDIVLVGDPTTAVETKIRLARIRFDRVVGHLAEASEVLARHPDLVERSSRLTIEQLAELRGLEPGLQIVDVRNPGEAASAAIPGTVAMPLPTLVDTIDRLDRDRPIVVYCASGYRSAIAGSVLRAAGLDDVSDLLGGYRAWSGAGLPTTRRFPDDGEDATVAVVVPEVTAEDASELVDLGAVLLDVREDDEWQAGHATVAAHLPMREVPARIEELDVDRLVVAICRSGGRSRAVAEALIGAGFDAVNVTGGMRAWVAAGLPVETDAGAPGTVI